MTKYNVHIYREMRLYYPGIEAGSPEEAAKLASDIKTGFSGGVEDCEGIDLSAGVDVEGDDDYEESKVIDFEPMRHINVAPKLASALQSLLALLSEKSNGVILECMGPRVPLIDLLNTARAHEVLKEARDAIAEAEGRSA